MHNIFQEEIYFINKKKLIYFLWLQYFRWFEFFQNIQNNH